MTSKRWIRGFAASAGRRATFIVGMAVAVAGVALVGSVQRDPSYSSEAKVLVQPDTSASAGASAALAPNMATEEELAQSPQVVDRVVRRLGLSTTQAELVAQLRVDPAESAGAQILFFIYTHPDPVVARERAQAFADAYVAIRRISALAGETERRRSLLAEIDVIERRAISMADEARHTADPGLRMSLKVRAKALEGLVADQRAALSLPTQPPNVASVVQDASASKAAPVPSPLIIAGVGLLMGLAGALTVTAISASLDERPRGVDQLAAATGVPVLASIPAMHAVGRRRGRLDTLRAPGSGAAAAFQTLATLLAARRRDHEVLMVTSADPGEGSSTVAANLAVAMADRGVAVALVDCDPRHPSVHRLFQVPSTPGLIHVLAGTAELGDALSPSGVAGLTIFPVGRRTSRSGEVFASPRLGPIIRGIARSVDLVILDGPAVRVGYDAMPVALVSDTVLLVADALVGDVDRIATSCEQLRGMGATLLGAVLNHARAGSGVVSLESNELASSAYRSR